MQSIFNDCVVRTVLVTDASISCRKSDRMMLTKLGLDVLEVDGGGVHIFNYIKACLINSSLGKCITVDVIIMSPDFGGADIIQRIRQIGFKGIILGVTADKSSKVLLNLKEKGADAVLIKPLTRDKFLRAVKGGLLCF